MYNIYIIIIVIVTSLKSTETAEPEVVPQTQLSRREASKQDRRGCTEDKPRQPSSQKMGRKCGHTGGMSPSL